MPHYKTEELFEKAIELIKGKRLFFITDVITLLGIASSTFSSHFPVGSEGHTKICEAIEQERVAVKISLRSKWYNSENPTLQMGLMKLVSTDDELRRLTQSYNDNKSEHKGEITIVREIIE